MKRMFTLLSGLFLAIAVMAADHRPVVTVKSMNNYKLVIDGRTYFSNNGQLMLSNLNRGYHSIQVFEMRRGYYQRREVLLGSSSFFLKRNDIRIFINRYGEVMIREQKDFGRFEREDDDWYRQDRDRNRDNDRGRDYDRGRDDNRDWNRGNDRQRF